MIFKQHLFKNTIPLLGKSLEAYAMRQKTIAKNIANATTPGYVPERVKFEELFNNAQTVVKGSKTNDSHIPIGIETKSKIRGEVTNKEIPQAEQLFSGESHVNIDKEMAELAENQIKFRFAARMTKRYFSGISKSISGYLR